MIKYYALVNQFNNKIKINCFNKLAYICLRDNAKNNKFFLKQKVNIFLINNKKRLQKQIFALLFFLHNISIKDAKITIFICFNFIEIKTIKIFKTIMLRYYFLRDLRNIRENCTIEEIYRRFQAM